MNKFVAALVAGLVVGSWPVRSALGQQSGPGAPSTAKALPQEANRNVADMSKVVFHLDEDRDEILTLALENIKNLFKEIPPLQCQVCLVSNGKAVKLFHKDRVGQHAADIEHLRRSGVRFAACRNALAKNHMEKADLHPACEIVPAGIVELIRLQGQGFAYIKP